MSSPPAPRPRPDRPETWINGRIREIFRELFALGHVHTVECWRDHRLVGGLYGLSLGGAFFGESMFHRETDASKVALVHLVARLRRGGYRLLDAQFQTGHLAQFGTQEVPRAAYQGLLEQARRRRRREWWSWPKRQIVSGGAQALAGAGRAGLSRRSASAAAGRIGRAAAATGIGREEALRRRLARRDRHALRRLHVDAPARRRQRPGSPAAG